MAALTNDAIRKVLGPVDETLTAAMLKIGATEAELIEARGWWGADEALHKELRRFPSGRVAALVELLEQHETAPEELR
ncbi:MULTISPECIES: hypothetical protein [unclassified Roseitalea]|uniref:hypothetical protein n=1 Tax=unclassified Roseitalea TaxID=2639107 RepID=UPI00273E1E3F|nr:MULTISPECIES: hypothetical protein [unclassified Roseitalea]